MVVESKGQHEFDWTPATEDSITMYVTMGQETDSTYQVIFRSYTAALTYFYVNKANGSTRLVEYDAVHHQLITIA